MGEQNPHDDALDVEAPNEGASGDHPVEGDEGLAHPHAEGDVDGPNEGATGDHPAG